MGADFFLGFEPALRELALAMMSAIVIGR